MNDLSPRSFLTYLPIISLAIIVARPAIAQKNDAAQAVVSHASLVVSVMDEQGAAIDGVDVCVMRWTGKMEPYLPSKAINKDGRFYIDNLDTEKMFYLRVMADGFASSMQSLLSLTAGETRSIPFKLTRPATGWTIPTMSKTIFCSIAKVVFSTMMPWATARRCVRTNLKRSMKLFEAHP